MKVVSEIDVIRRLLQSVAPGGMMALPLLQIGIFITLSLPAQKTDYSEILPRAKSVSGFCKPAQLLSLHIPAALGVYYSFQRP